MIYVRRDPSVFPEELLRAAEAAQATLETLPPDARGEFIKKNAAIWRAFSRILAKMSYGKCWYSESADPQAFFDIDHFRPKSEAVRSDGSKDSGYPWLAFSWDNFRFAAQRSNRKSTDEDTDLVVGKGSWFGLLPGSPKASWEHRCVSEEQPMLLDPTVRADVDLIDINDEAMVCGTQFCVGSSSERVEASIERYGLNLPRLVSARKRVMREIVDVYENLMDLKCVAEVSSAVQQPTVNRHIEQLRRTTLPDQAYSKAARAKLIALGLGAFCAQPEDVPGL